MIQAILFISVLLATHQETEQQNDAILLVGVKCIVSGKPASPKYFVKYKQGKLFFDCNASRLKFESSKGVFRTKANHHLVVTGQYIQNKCPNSKATIPGQSPFYHPVAGLRIRFCCEACLEQFAEKTTDRKINALFDQHQFSSLFLPRPKLSKTQVAEKR